MDKLILKILKEETRRLQIESHNIYLDRVVNLVSLLTENDDEREPDMVWDFTDVKQNIDKSKGWVKTKEDVIEYLKNLLKKLENVQLPVKKKILKYVLYSFLGILTMTQIVSIEDEVIGTKVDSTPNNITQVVKPKQKKVVDVKIREVSPDLIGHLKYEEGSIYDKGEPVLTAYDLGDGAYTIGYGHAIFSNPRRGDNGGKYKFLPKYNKITPGRTTITKEQAEILLNDDIQIATESLNKILNDWEEQGIKPKISQGMYNSMISLIFNMGITNFRKSDFIQLVKQNKLEEAREEIKNISSNLFRKYPGLKIRRENEYGMFKL
jgi:GH24 family phage-related lysozyme (muramidase)